MRYSHLKTYAPQVRQGYIYCRHPSAKDPLRYNHDVDVVRFKGRYYAAWNANHEAAEGVAGQYNVLSHSDDYLHWSPPVRMFADAAYCANPVTNDSQWQPGFINVNDEYLLCAWCTHARGPKMYVSRSYDGVHWENREVQNAPSALLGLCMGFPTNHGFISRTGRLMFPCSLPPNPKPPGDNYLVGETEYSGVLMSDDRGETWFWSEPIRTADWRALGEDPQVRGTEFATTWEPMVFDTNGGALGLLVRNSTTQEDASRPDKPHQMLFYTRSEDDGMTWARAWPTQVQTLCSRNFTAGANDAHGGLYMIHNDQPARVPVKMSGDRYHLALFLAPVTDPDLLLPGPVMLPAGRAFYPNGFVQDGRLYLGATHNGVLWMTVDPLPDYAEPFLMVRQARLMPQLTDGLYNFPARQSTLCLVLSRALTEADNLTLRFEQMVMDYATEDYPILTLGGVSERGLTLCAGFDHARQQCQLIAVSAARERTVLADYTQGQWNNIAVTMDMEKTSFTINGQTTVVPVACARKIAFGGLYEAPAWPQEENLHSTVLLRSDSIVLEDTP